MAGRTLCLPDSSLPSIGKDESGEVSWLTWNNLDKVPAAAPVPRGSFYLVVERGIYVQPPLEKTEPSDLPDMRQIPQGRSTFLFPEQAKLNGQSFQLECHLSINPQGAQKGGYDCQIVTVVASGIRIRVHFETVVWADGPAWPPLDSHWTWTWPPYLADLEAGINNLLSLQ